MAGRTLFVLLVLAEISARWAARAADSWAVWQGNAAHSGYVPETLVVRQTAVRVEQVRTLCRHHRHGGFRQCRLHYGQPHVPVFQ